MTREHWKALLPVITEYAEGKEVQYLSTDNTWIDCPEPQFVGNRPYRIKPTPKLRPWKEGEIPLGALWSTVSAPHIVFTASLVHKDHIQLSNRDYHLTTLATHWQHSLDNGKTWLPCGVMEDQ